MDICRIFLLSSILAISNMLFNNAYAQLVPPSVILDKATRGTALGMERAITQQPTKPLSQKRELYLPVLTQDIDLGEATKYKFKLKEIAFKGNTVISDAELLRTYRPYFGRTITLAKLLTLIKKTTKIYRDEGYVLSQAYLPAQDIDKVEGKVEIGIVEGYIHEVVVESESIPYSTKMLLKQYGEHMMAERPITKRTLERYSLLANDLPGGSIKIVFSPASQHPGAAIVEFVGEHNKIFGAEFYTNNRGTRLLGPNEYSWTLHQNNGLYGNKTTVNATRTERKDLRLYTINHRQPLNSDGLALSIIASKTRTQPDYRALPELNRTALETPGESESVLVQLEYPAIRSRDYNLLLQAKIEGNNNETSFLGETLFKEKLRPFRAGFVFDWLDSWVMDILAVSLIGVEYTHGISGLGASLQEPYRTRPNTKTDYNKITATISRTQPLPANFYLRLVGLGQYAFEEMTSAEEFGYGGRLMGLAYDPFQISGEHGLAGKAEAGYKVPMGELIQSIKEGMDLDHDSSLNSFISFNPELFAFYDAGRVWNMHHRISGQKEHDSAISAGFGIRGSIFEYLLFEGYFAKPLSREVENEIDKKPRYFFSLGASYS